MTAILTTYGKEIVSLLVPLIAWFLNSYLKSKAKLQVALPHQFTFLVQQPLLDSKGKQLSPSQTVHTNSFIVSNVGREPATKVELVFNWKPMCLNVWPLRHFEEHIEIDGRYVLIFESVAPNETLGCEVLSINQDLPKLMNVRCSECTAENITMYPRPVVGKGTKFFVAILLAIGLAAGVYLIILLLQFLILQTPLGR